MTRSSGEHHLVYNRARLLRILLKVIAESLTDRLRHNCLNITVAELGLCLTLKLRFGNLYGDYGCQAVAEVLFRKLDLKLVEKMIIVGIFLESRSQTAAEAGEVCATLDSVDVIDVGEDIFVEGGVVGHCDLNGNAILLCIDMDNFVDEGFLTGIDVFHEFLETFL